MLRLAFRAAGSAVVVLSDQRYAFAAQADLDHPGVLFDDQADARRRIPQDGCEVASGSQIFGELLAFDCWHTSHGPLRIYSIRSGIWRTLQPSPEITSCGAFNTCPWSLLAAGSYWLEFDRSICPMGEHCSLSNVFQNIRTGGVVRDPAVQGGNRIGDVDVPHLVRRLCKPITVPEGFNIFTSPGPGLLQLDGLFALASSPGAQGGSETYLEQYGTHLHQLLEPYTPAAYANPVAANPHAIVWQQKQTSLNIEFLPRGRRFNVPLPKALQGTVRPALTNKHLYLVQDNSTTENGTLWIASLPAKPPAT